MGRFVFSANFCDGGLSLCATPYFFINSVFKRILIGFGSDFLVFVGDDL